MDQGVRIHGDTSISMYTYQLLLYTLNCYTDASTTKLLSEQYQP